jgi:molybdopterin-guanine dinucleotide biosynthesis adapter protein
MTMTKTITHSKNGTPIIGVAGWKNSGKTTLTEKLVAELAARGYAIATVKHAHHAFQIDDGEADSARHRRAGAQQVAIVAASRWAIIRELKTAPEPDFEDVVGWLDPCDLIVVEGYKSQPIRKIEARRLQTVTKDALAANDPNVIAIAADHPVAGQRLPVFDLGDIAAIADFIVATTGLPARRTA